MCYHPACPLQVLPVPGTDPPPNPVTRKTPFWSVRRTSAGWLAVGQLTGENTAVWLSADGATWPEIHVSTFNTQGRVTLAQAVRNSPDESVVLANVANADDSWDDVFRSDDGGKTSFRALGVLTNDRVSNGPNLTLDKLLLILLLPSYSRPKLMAKHGTVGATSGSASCCAQCK